MTAKLDFILWERPVLKAIRRHIAEIEHLPKTQATIQAVDKYGAYLRDWYNEHKEQKAQEQR